MTVARSARPEWFVRPTRVFRPQTIVVVELREPVEDVAMAQGHDLYAVVVLDGVPLGSIELAAVGGTVHASEIVARVEEELGDRLIEELLVRSMLATGLHGRGHERVGGVRGAPVEASPPAVPSITVAVCTRDRPEDLRGCLAAVRRLDVPCEVLVIDNAPSDGRTREIVSGLPGCRYVEEPRPGLNWARNRAVLEATGDIVAFIDDDVTVDPGWARRVARAFAEDPDVMCVTGLVLPAELDHLAQRAFEDYGGFGKGFRRRWYRAELSGTVPNAGRLWATGNCGTGANMAYRRCVFSSTGLFDPALDVGTLTGGGGDLEMFFRVIKHGWTLLYDPAAFVWHRHRRTLPELKRQIESFGSVASVLQASAQRFPDERRALIKGELAYLRRWHATQLRKVLRPSNLGPRLAYADLAGHGRALFGRRYARAVRAAQAMQDGSIVDVALLPEAPHLAMPSVEGGRMAIRRVRVDEPLAGIGDLAGYRSVRVFVEEAGTVIGQVDIDVQGRDLARERLALAIVETMGPDLLVAPGSRGATRRRAARLARAEALEILATSRTAVADVDGAASVGSVSIVISTANRPESLDRCLASLDRALPNWQQSLDVEVIVVQNGPNDDRTDAVVNRFGSVKLVHEPRQGVSYGRNAGLAVASGEVAVILDDDEVVDASWLLALIAPFADESVGLVTGNVLPAELEEPAQQLFERHSTLSRGHEERRADARWLDSFGWRATPPTWNFGGTANLAVRRSVFEDPAVGPFDEVLGPGTPTGVGEDTMLFYRVLARGHRIVYEPRAVSWHFHRHSMEALLRQQRAYYSGHVAYSMMTFFRHADMRGLTHLAGLARWHADELRRTRTGGDLPRSLWWARASGSLAGPYNLAHSVRKVRRLRKSTRGGARRAGTPRRTP